MPSDPAEPRTEVVVLEDDPRRRAAMRAVLAEQVPGCPPRFFTTAPEAARYLADHPGRVRAVALDHDLDPIPVHPRRSLDAGTGRDVADVLAARRPFCEVVIHTTNRPAALGMERELAEGGWTTRTVVPHGDLGWVRTDWIAAVRAAAGGDDHGSQGG